MHVSFDACRRRRVVQFDAFQTIFLRLDLFAQRRQLLYQQQRLELHGEHK
jgi:hypothetical protein